MTYFHVNGNWLTWQNVKNATPYITAIPGCVALYRTIRNERTRLTFRIEPSESWQDPYPDQVGPSRCVVEVTITNEGARPVTIRACCCAFVYETSMGDKSRIGQAEVDNKLGLGDACTVSVNLPMEPYNPEFMAGQSRIVSLPSIYALDSTSNKQWKPSKKEMRRFLQAARQIWPLRDRADPRSP